MKKEDLLSKRALRWTEGNQITSSWQYLQKRWDLQLQEKIEGGAQGATLRVSSLKGEAALKILTVPRIWTSQYAALRGAPNTPEIWEHSHRHQAWLLEWVPGKSGQSGKSSLEDYAGALQKFQSGKRLGGIYPLLPFHMLLAQETGCQEVLRAEDRLRSLRARECLLHGDARPENFIEDQAIDPTGLWGDPAFDWATLALYSKDPLSALESVSEMFSRERIENWAWLRATLDLHQARLYGDDTSHLEEILRQL